MRGNGIFWNIVMGQGHSLVVLKIRAFSGRSLFNFINNAYKKSVAKKSLYRTLKKWLLNHLAYRLTGRFIVV
jgi:hypothetical protein